MSHLSTTVRVDAPAEVVYDIVVDPVRGPEWQTLVSRAGRRVRTAGRRRIELRRLLQGRGAAARGPVHRHRRRAADAPPGGRHDARRLGALDDEDRADRRRRRARSTSRSSTSCPARSSDRSSGCSAGTASSRSSGGRTRTSRASPEAVRRAEIRRPTTPPPDGAATPVSRIELRDPTLVVLVGAAGSGKSTFAARQFDPSEVLSSDAFREILTGDAADQRATKTAFSIIHREVSKRLAAGRTVVVDATNVERPRAAGAAQPGPARRRSGGRDRVCAAARGRPGTERDAARAGRRPGHRGAAPRPPRGGAAGTRRRGVRARGGPALGRRRRRRSRSAGPARRSA